MKRIVLSIIIMLIVNSMNSQALESLGAGVIDFLMKNPKTANKMNSTEAAALDVLGNLLSTSAARKHQLNVAQAGKNEILINTAEANSAKIYMDFDGNIYMLFNGMIFPIAQTLVNQAKEELTSPNSQQNQSINPYDLNELRKSFKALRNYKTESSGPKTYTVRDTDGEYMSDIVLKNNVRIEDLKLKYYRGRETKALIEKMRRNEIKAKYGTIFEFYVKQANPSTKILFLFTCKWYNDFHDDGIDFEDFQGIKNQYDVDEKIMVTFGYYTSRQDLKYKIELFNSYDGELVIDLEGEIMHGRNIIYENIPARALDPGIFIISVKLRNQGKTIATKIERIEVTNNLLAN